MESITTNREDEPFIWVLKADLACIVFYRNQADTAAAEADDLRVIIIMSAKEPGSRKFLGHFKSYSGSQISSESSG